MLKIIITSTAVRNMNGIGKASGKEYDMNFQDAWIHLVGPEGVAEPYPQKIELILPKAKDGAPLFYATGEYVMDPSSIYVDRGGKLVVAPRLVPAPKQANRATA